MKLFEITNGGLGYSYVRAYSWAENEQQAVELYKSTNPKSRIESIKELFDSSSPPFCTKNNGDGF